MRGLGGLLTVAGLLLLAGGPAWASDGFRSPADQVDDRSANDSTPAETAAVTPNPGSAVVVRPVVVAAPPRSERFELIVGETSLHRDAFAAAARVGRVVRGELLTYVDFVDRRLRILNALILDGGYWIKVRAADGREGWLPAKLLREAR